MDQFYKDLVEKIRDAAEKRHTEDHGRNRRRKRYMPALVTDSDCVSPVLAVNTLASI